MYFVNSLKKQFLLFLILIIVSLVAVLTVLYFIGSRIRGNGFRDLSPSVYLLSDGFHSGLLIPNSEGLFKLHFSAELSASKYVYYTFADEKWYLQGRQSFCAIFPTLFTPTAGVIERIFVQDVFTPDEARQYFNFEFKTDIWSFKTSRQELSRVITAIEHDEITDTHQLWHTTWSKRLIYDYLPAKHKYSLLFNCHQFNLHMLNLAGIKITTNPLISLDFLLRIHLSLAR